VLVRLGDHRCGHRRVREIEERLWREVVRWCCQPDRTVEPAQGCPPRGNGLLEVVSRYGPEEFVRQRRQPAEVDPGLGPTGLVDVDDGIGERQISGHGVLLAVLLRVVGVAIDHHAVEDGESVVGEHGQ